MSSPFFLEKQTQAHQQQRVIEAEKARLGDEARAATPRTPGMWFAVRQRLGSAVVRVGERIRGKTAAALPVRPVSRPPATYPDATLLDLW